MRTAGSISFMLALSACATPVDRQLERAELADASFLVPLRGVPDFGATTEAGHGTLLPQDQYDLLEPLTPIDKPEDILLNLDVVAVRLDPCFFEGTGEPTCTPQVRLVLQPVFDDGDGVTSRDATVHLFYAVPLDEVRELASRLVGVRLDAGGSGDIGEHVDPEAAVAEVLPHVGADRLTRMTFVAVHASNEAWTFGGFDFVDGSHTVIEPPGVDDHEQHLTSTGGTKTLDASILPTPTIEPAIVDYLERVLRDGIDAAEEDAALAALRRLQSPEAHNPGTVDCASCHMATPALRFAAGADGAGAPPDVYLNSQNQRMLGFFERAPAVSPRVVAETEQVLTVLQSGL